jgi:hypothetical protein
VSARALLLGGITKMFWRRKKKMLEHLRDLNSALGKAQQVAENALAAAAETRALLQRSQATSDRWRELYEHERNRPVVVEIVLVPEAKAVN